MSLSAPWIRRPIATTLTMSGIALFGAFAYPQLPVSDLPNVDYPVINVRASLPGASPQTMAAAVATPLEKQFSTIAGLEAMSSNSSLGSTNVTLQFALHRNIDAAAQDVQAALSQVQRQLPQGTNPPSYQKSNPADSPILFLALTSDLLPLPALDEYAQTTLAQRISTVDGVAQVQVFGSQKYAVRIQLDPQAMAARGVGIDQVSDAISSGNVNLPTGVLWGPDLALTLRSSNQLENARAFRDLIVKSQDGASVRLGDLGQVVDAVENIRQASWFNGRRAIVLAIQRQPGTNTVRVADAVHAMVDRLRPQLPGSVSIETLNDRSISIRHSVTDVQLTLLIALVLVVGVIFLFLRNASATLIPSLALPLSILGTFALMKPLGFSLDNLSLMALTLSLGFVVDDAIVMLENCVRHMEMGKPPMRAAEDGAREIGFTILSMTLSLVAVFIPVLFMGGLLGRLFHEFAIVISVAILISGFVSLTLTPMMASRFLRPGAHHSGNPVLRASEAAFDASLQAYKRSLGWVMQHRRATLVFSAAILAGTVGLFMVIPKGFIPAEDINQLTGTTETAEGTSFESMVRHQQQIAAILEKEPDLEGFMSAVGGGPGGGSSNQGRLVIRLKGRHHRKLDATQIARQLTPKLNSVPGIRVFIQNPPPIRVGARFAKSQYQYTLAGTDLVSLYENAGRLEAKLRELPALENVTSDLLIKNPEIRVELDRDRAATLGVSPRQVDEALYDAYGSRQVSTIFTPSNQYWVVMELLPRYQRDVAALQLLNVRSSSGELVPIGAVARLVPGLGPLTVSHSGQLPAVTLSFDVKPGTGLSEAVSQIQAAARSTLSSDISTSFAGAAQAFQSSQQGLTVLLLLAVLVIYLVLGVLYESFVHPITILSGLPFAGFGALLTLVLFRTELSVYAFVGVILLIGLVKKNAIMMIDFAIAAERNEGKSPREAILEACRVRFRPIMMTTMAALMGTLPIAIGWGAGAESRRPLGLAVVGGLAFSQIITLYVTPVFYTYLAGIQERWEMRRRGARPAAGPDVAPAGLPAAGPAGETPAQSTISKEPMRMPNASR
jgi:HAE1 family hydrophobic/amphiphilic exporter-1